MCDKAFGSRARRVGDSCDVATFRSFLVAALQATRTLSAAVSGFQLTKHDVA